MKKIITLFILMSVFVTTIAQAGISKNMLNRLKDYYKPAEDHVAMKFAHTEPDLTKMNGKIIVRRGGIPAERAEFYINWDEYDYRGVKIKGDDIKTRHGSVYTYIKPGTIMWVVDVSKFGRTVYFKLMSEDIYKPENKLDEKYHSRVTVKLGIILPRQITQDFDEIIKYIGKWILPPRATLVRKVKKQSTSPNLIRKRNIKPATTQVEKPITKNKVSDEYPDLAIEK